MLPHRTSEPSLEVLRGRKTSKTRSEVFQIFSFNYYEGGVMEERFIEIRFCYWIKKVMVEFRYSYHILDVIDAYCLLGDIDSTLIKQLMQQVKKNAGPITTNKEETCYVARKLDYSFREIQSLTGISLGSQSRIQEMLKNYSEFDILKPCIATDYHEAVRRFMRVVDIMKGV